MKKSIILFLAFFGLVSISKAQVSAGINFQNTRTFITVGTNPDKEFFGEARLGLGQEVGLELVGAYNFVQKSEVNAYFGIGLGLFDYYNRRKDRYYNDSYLVVPIGVLIKPLDNKNFGFLMEAAPVIYGNEGSYLRGGIGFKYTFR
ncbi:outer membrane insertion C- signal [Algoriphagus boseongensis]|uniref:outer membrane insertion C- signal n=1 Tax=Algoriphagus boseongensis TaxID=1442587 RepID=UPI00105B7E9C|nr:outer membrane insertion C- signal [Algoriphagus boseongensis]